MDDELKSGVLNWLHGEATPFYPSDTQCLATEIIKTYHCRGKITSKKE
jgi:hypothetical protein